MVFGLSDGSSDRQFDPEGIRHSKTVLRSKSLRVVAERNALSIARQSFQYNREPSWAFCKLLSPRRLKPTVQWAKA